MKNMTHSELVKRRLVPAKRSRGGVEPLGGALPNAEAPKDESFEEKPLEEPRQQGGDGDEPEKGEKQEDEPSPQDEHDDKPAEEDEPCGDEDEHGGGSDACSDKSLVDSDHGSELL